MVGSCIFGKFVSMSDTRFFRGSLILRMGDFWYFTGNNCFDLKDWFNLLGIYFCDFQKAVIIAILTDYKQVFWYLNFANHKTKESFVSTANKALVGTLMTTGDVTASIAISNISQVPDGPVNSSRPPTCFIPNMPTGLWELRTYPSPNPTVTLTYYLITTCWFRRWVSAQLPRYWYWSRLCLKKAKPRMAKSRLHFANRLSKDCSPFTRKQVYLGVKTCEGFICFVAIVRVCYVDFFVFFVLRRWWVSQVFTPRMSR